ncbi:hypothetical protein L2735_08045 [Shewanella olleyana]|uniref:tetratricopeptide repeat protein n=1 Tax=Shewanella olleyana TaxID=135626 RepID=UPI00200F81AF|nr:hypothetical protein [Shewanella olleyana]MCL1066757.1 hypothetical protein [Shewanella olleyana]
MPRKLSQKLLSEYFKKQLFTPLYITQLFKTSLFNSQFNSKLILCTGILSCSLLSACSSTTSTSPVSPLPMPETGHYFAKLKAPASVPSIESLSALLPEQEQELNEFITRDDIASLSKRHQVARFIQDKMVNFNYEGLNYTTSEAWQKRSGNCMALAMLTFGVAKHLDVKAVFQVVHSAPLLTHISNDLIVSSDHVRTFLYESDIAGVYFNNSEFSVIDYFPDRNDRSGAVVFDAEFLAMFYRNLAADAILKDQLTLSFALLEQGLKLAPEYIPLINMMAVVHRRVNDHATAESYYQYGLQFENNSLTLLSNYGYSLTEEGRLDEAEAIFKQLLSLENDTPYGWYSMGIEAYSLKDYSTAETYFQKFINNSPYYHQAYFELAKALSAQGKTLKAEKTLKQALELTSMDDSQQKYLAKLNWLKQGS